MVNDSAQLYTIEGVAAGVLMVVTAYLAISSTTVLTQQDVHIIDMQLQQLGSDALAMMDIPDTFDKGTSNLTNDITFNNVSTFRNQFLGYLSATTGTGTENNIYNYSATIYYRNSTGAIESYPFNENPYYRENAVKVTRWVYLPNGIDATGPPIDDLKDGQPHSVLLEVLLWRQ